MAALNQQPSGGQPSPAYLEALAKLRAAAPQQGVDAERAPLDQSAEQLLAERGIQPSQDTQQQAAPQQGQVTLNIEGKRVKIDAGFLQMSPEQQNAVVHDIAAKIGIGAQAQQQPQEMDGNAGQQNGDQVSMGDAMAELSGLSQRAQVTPEMQAQLEADYLEKMQGKGGAGSLFKGGFTMGLQDKVAGLAGGVGDLLKGKNFSEGYQRSSRAQQILEERQRERSGALGKAAEIGGSLATGVLAKAPAAASAIGRIYQGGKEAAILGTGQGLGDSEATDLAGMGRDAFYGGVTGAGLGAGLGTGLEAAGGLIRSAIGTKRAVGGLLRNDSERAADKVVRSLADDGISPELAAARVSRRDTPLMNVADENTLGLARAVSAKPGEGRTLINSTLDSQQRASRGNILAAVNDTLGGNKSYSKEVADLIQTRSQNGKTLFDAAFRKNFDNAHPAILDDLATRVPSEALVNAQKIAAAEGRPFGQQLIAHVAEDGSYTLTRQPSLREWHYIQRGIRAAKDAAYRNGIGEVGTAYGDLHRQLLSTLKSASPEYRLAMEKYADSSSLINALGFGREILSPSSLRNVDELPAIIGGMSRAEKDMAKIGLTRQIQDTLQNTPNGGDMVRKIFGTEAKRNAIAATFDNPTEFRRFEASMLQRAKEAKAYNYVRQGSRTSFVDAEKDAANGLADIASMGVDAATGGVGNATVKAAMKLLKGVGGMSDGVSREVARIMVQRDPAAVMRALSPSIRRKAGQQAVDDFLTQAAKVARTMKTGAASAGAGSSVQQQYQ